MKNYHFNLSCKVQAKSLSEAQRELHRKLTTIVEEFNRVGVDGWSDSPGIQTTFSEGSTFSVTEGDKLPPPVKPKEEKKEGEVDTTKPKGFAIGK